MKLGGKIKKKDLKQKKNSNKKNGDQIWHKNKLKSNVKGWNWKQNRIRKMIKIERERERERER